MVSLRGQRSWVYCEEYSHLSSICIKTVLAVKALFNKDLFYEVSSGSMGNEFCRRFRAIEKRSELTRKLNLDLMQIAQKNEGGGVEKQSCFHY
jgi:hypothetical protein